MTPGINIHIYPSDMTSESRMMKITSSFKEWGYFSRIFLLGVQSPGTKAEEAIDERREIRRYPRSIGIVRGAMVKKLLATLRWSWAIWRDMSGLDIRVINCHSLPVLPLCVALKWRHKAVLVYDTHELETETTESHGTRQKLAKALERTLIRYCDLTIVVGDMIAKWYANAYDIEKPLVIRNIPLRGAVALADATDSPLRAKLGLGAEAIIVLYLGKLSENRGIERLLDIFSHLKRPVHLVFMGDGALTSIIQQASRTYGHIHWLAPVPMKDVVAHARGADMGMSVVDHSCLSYTYSMPNKFFEYLQAGVPVLIGDMPEQREIIERAGAGWMLPEDDAAAIAFLEGLTREEVDAKKRGAAAISGEYSWEREAETLHAAYEALRVKRPGKF